MSAQRFFSVRTLTLAFRRSTSLRRVLRHTRLLDAILRKRLVQCAAPRRAVVDLKGIAPLIDGAAADVAQGACNDRSRSHLAVGLLRTARQDILSAFICLSIDEQTIVCCCCCSLYDLLQQHISAALDALLPPTLDVFDLSTSEDDLLRRSELRVNATGDISDCVSRFGIPLYLLLGIYCYNK